MSAVPNHEQAIEELLAPLRYAVALLGGPRGDGDSEYPKALVALGAVRDRLEELTQALDFLLKQVDDVERTSVIRESAIYRFARQALIEEHPGGETE